MKEKNILITGLFSDDYSIRNKIYAYDLNTKIWELVIDLEALGLNGLGYRKYNIFKIMSS